MTDYTHMPIDEMEAIWAGGFKRARAALDVSAFGLSVSDLPPDFNHVPYHVHTFDGQEELYFALGGSGWLEVNGTRVPLTSESLVRVGPTASRRPIAGPEGIRLLAIGGIPGQPYTPFPNSMPGAPEPKIADLPGVQAAHEHDSSDDFSELDLASFEPHRATGVAIFPVRKELGITSFGVSVIDIERVPEVEGGSDYPLHDHAESGQEEVYVIVSGSGEMEIGDERVELGEGDMVRVAPEVKRRTVAGDDGLRMVAIGGVPGGAYEPPQPGKGAS